MRVADTCNPDVYCDKYIYVYAHIYRNKHADRYNDTNLYKYDDIYTDMDADIYRDAYKYATTDYLYSITGTNSLFYFNLGQRGNRQWAVWKPVGTGSKQQRRRVCSGLYQ